MLAALDFQHWYRKGTVHLSTLLYAHHPLCRWGLHFLHEGRKVCKGRPAHPRPPPNQVIDLYVPPVLLPPGVSRFSHPLPLIRS